MSPKRSTSPRPSEATSSTKPSWSDSRSAAARAARSCSTRARERYRGDTEPVDARPGHIPSAVNAPFADLLVAKADGTTGLKSKSELEAYFRSLGAGAADDIVVYCGSGVTACLDVLALERAGFAALIYEGSYSDWARDDRLPVALGDR